MGEFWPRTFSKGLVTGKTRKPRTGVRWLYYRISRTFFSLGAFCFQFDFSISCALCHSQGLPFIWPQLPWLSALPVFPRPFSSHPIELSPFDLCSPRSKELAVRGRGRAFHLWRCFAFKEIHIYPSSHFIPVADNYCCLSHTLVSHFVNKEMSANVLQEKHLVHMEVSIMRSNTKNR